MKATPTIKVYVKVAAVFEQDGSIRPQTITWEDGREYKIDKVLEMRSSASAKAGGQGDRYTVQIGGQHSYLFFEHSAAISGNRLGRWFVERRQPV